MGYRGERAPQLLRDEDLLRRAPHTPGAALVSHVQWYCGTCGGSFTTAQVKAQAQNGVTQDTVSAPNLCPEHACLFHVNKSSGIAPGPAFTLLEVSREFSGNCTFGQVRTVHEAAPNYVLRPADLTRRSADVYIERRLMSSGGQHDGV